MVRAFARWNARALERQARLWTDHPYIMTFIVMLSIMYRVTAREYDKNEVFRNKVDAQVETASAWLNERIHG